MLKYRVDELNISMYQDADPLDTSCDGYQELNVTIYPNAFIHLSTRRWAIDFDEIDEFANILKVLCKNVKKIVDENNVISSKELTFKNESEEDDYDGVSEEAGIV